ncbi:MAG: hypothetical protein N2510_04460 [Ignavibacteria bacterium]|nr:hypothetical protein [Ignavibacteria bacterium]
MIFYEEIFRTFNQRKVKYVVVGGFAVNLLGALRTTYDLDILTELSKRNLKKIFDILTNQGYKTRVPVDFISIADTNTKEEFIKKKNMKAFNFYMDYEMKAVDIIIDTPVSYEEAIKDAVKVKAGGLVIPVISIDNLIKMKKKSARTVDKLDIEELKIVKKLSEKL